MKRMQRRSKPLLRWLRGEPVITGDLITLDADSGTICELGVDIEILSDFASIYEPRDVSVFIRKYGLLRIGPSSDVHMEERLSMWQAQVTRIRFIMNLNQALRKALRGDEEGVQELWTYEAELLDISLYDRLSIDSDEELLMVTSEALAKLITVGLVEVRETVHSDLDIYEGPSIGKNLGEYSFSAQIPHLYALIYYILANAVVISWPTRKCEECGRVFVAKDKRQRFCSSTCAGRGRYQRFAAKKKNKNSAESTN